MEVRKPTWEEKAAIRGTVTACGVASVLEILAEELRKFPILQEDLIAKAADVRLILEEHYTE